jgi:hypothetical protein
MTELTPSQKGAAAEAEITAALIRLNLVVLRPMCEGGRYDLAIDTGVEILRVQCKWASRRGNVLTARCITSRHTPRGYLRSTYSAEEIDAIAVYAPDTDRCYLIPVGETEGHVTLSLRLTPTRTTRPSASVGHTTMSSLAHSSAFGQSAHGNPALERTRRGR